MKKIGFNMLSKKFILALSIFLVFISLFGAYAAEYYYSISEVNEMMQDVNSSELTGCCSVVYQLNGTDSIISFRRDANNTADIYIEEIDWHGKNAIKQYKTDGGYFSQVIITSDGWIIGYGGIDDGKDSETVENITAKMISNDSSISEDGLVEIQNLKSKYRMGHVVIKAPNGNYGVAMADTHFRGKLAPGDYISVPNRHSYYREGNFSLSDPDKIKTMNDLARSDGFGITRRDITTFYFHSVDNSSFKGNITDIYLSNDDGSVYEIMNSTNLYDDVHFRDNVINGSSLPIAPAYIFIGSVEFTQDAPFGFFDLAIIAITAILLGTLIYFVLQYLKYMRYRNRRRRRR